MKSKWNLHELQIKTIHKCLEHYNWNRTEAAKALGVSTAKVVVFIKVLRKRGIEIPQNPMVEPSAF